MELEKILQRFKKVRPDADYAASSRRIILATVRPAKKPFGALRFILSNIQSASAIALMSFLFILIFGGFSVFKILNPFRLSSLDPVSLRAEADAIDMQLQVAGVTYDGTVPGIRAVTAGATTTSVVPPLKGRATAKPPGGVVASPSPESTSSATSSVPSSQTPSGASSASSSEPSTASSSAPAPVSPSSTPSVTVDPVFSALDILSN